VVLTQFQPQFSLDKAVQFRHSSLDLSGPDNDSWTGHIATDISRHPHRKVTILTYAQMLPVDVYFENGLTQSVSSNIKAGTTSHYAGDHKLFNWIYLQCIFSFFTNIIQSEQFCGQTSGSIYLTHIKPNVSVCS